MVKNRKNLNIIWIIVDSVRNYKDGDKYGKLEIMEKFANESIEFTNVVTSAVSTLMSVSSMISSKPAYYIGRDFEQFKYDKVKFPPLTDILKSNGYQIYTIHHYPPARDKMKDILYPISSRYWPNGVNRYKIWNEKEINSIFSRLSEKGIKEPFFLYIHYDVPSGNQSTSKRVNFVLNKLKDKGIYDNSIIILCSDHGYPNPKRVKLSLKDKILEGHDLCITDDNSLIPLMIKYPGCIKGKKIHNIVSSLDIVPTLLSLLSIAYKKQQFEGINLLEIINGQMIDRRKLRTDTRYCFQPKRITSLRGNKYKYINHFNSSSNNVEHFFDLKDDPSEHQNLINSTDKKIVRKINEFKKKMVSSEKIAMGIHKEYLSRKFKELSNGINMKEKPRILLFGSSNMPYIKIILENISRSWQDSQIDLMIKKNSSSFLEINSNKVNIIFSKLTYKDFKYRLNNIKHKKYDVVIIPLVNHLGIGYQQIFKIARKINSKRTIKVDYNMDLVTESSMWIAILKNLKENFMANIFDWKNFGGRLVLLAKRIIFDKYF
jgi:hypothetical protein